MQLEWSATDAANEASRMRARVDLAVAALGDQTDKVGWERLKKNLSNLLCFMGSLFHNVNENAIFKYCAKSNTEFS